MIAFSNCKINIGLNILRKRPDDYHDIESVFYPVQWCDVLEILPAKKPGITIHNTGITVKTDFFQNLCVKAYQLLKNDFPALPGVSVHLHKMIPMGAGLGGGSSNAVFTLRLLAGIFSLNITSEKFKEYALKLGSDCPFFLINEPCIATGRGESLEAVSNTLAGYKIILIFPGIHCNTAKAFSAVSPALAATSLKDSFTLPVSEWKHFIKNDFEQTIFSDHPAIQKIKEQLYAAGAEYASLSGSGSGVYGVFKNAIPALHFPQEYLVHSSELK